MQKAKWILLIIVFFLLLNVIITQFSQEEKNSRINPINSNIHTH